MVRAHVIFLLVAVAFATGAATAMPSMPELHPRGPPHCSGTILTASGVGTVDGLSDQALLGFTFQVNSGKISEATASARKFLDALANNVSAAVPNALVNDFAIKHMSYGVSYNNPELKATTEGDYSEKQADYGELPELSSPVQDDDTVALNVSLKMVRKITPDLAILFDDVTNKRTSHSFVRMNVQAPLPKDLSEESMVKVVDATIKALQELKDSSMGAMLFGSDELQFYPGSRDFRVQWRMSDEAYAEARKAARKQAMQAAVSKAQEIAELLDVQLDQARMMPISINEEVDAPFLDMNDGNSYDEYYEGMDSISIRPSVRKVTGAMTLVYCIPPTSSATVGNA